MIVPSFAAGNSLRSVRRPPALTCCLAPGRQLLIWTGGDFDNPLTPVLSVDVQTTPTFKAGTPHVLFPRPDIPCIAVSRDLQRFLAAVPVEGAAPPSIAVIMNWQEALKR